MEDAGDEETFSDPPSPSTSLSPPPGRSFFDGEGHVMFLEMMYQMLPYHYQSQEINRLTLAYFVISGLDLLNALDRVSFYIPISPHPPPLSLSLMSVFTMCARFKAKLHFLFEKDYP